MPSRKKAKGKARKAAKEAKAKEESRAVVAVADSQRPVQEESLEVQMQRLIISAASPTMCEQVCLLYLMVRRRFAWILWMHSMLYSVQKTKWGKRCTKLP